MSPTRGSRSPVSRITANAASSSRRTSVAYTFCRRSTPRPATRRATGSPTGGASGTAFRISGMLFRPASRVEDDGRRRRVRSPSAEDALEDQSPLDLAGRGSAGERVDELDAAGVLERREPPVAVAAEGVDVDR